MCIRRLQADNVVGALVIRIGFWGFLIIIIVEYTPNPILIVKAPIVTARVKGSEFRGERRLGSSLNSGPFRVRLIRVPYFTGNPKRDPTLENYSFSGLHSWAV